MGRLTPTSRKFSQYPHPEKFPQVDMPCKRLIPPLLNKKVHFTTQQMTQFLFAHNIFFWIIILITAEMNIIDYQFNLTSWSLFFIEKTREIR